MMSIYSPRDPFSPDPLPEEPRSKRRVKAEERPDRKKRWTTKVKTGCATCRYVPTRFIHNVRKCFTNAVVLPSTHSARRIKCDEGKPVCRRCVFSKRQCGGYMDQPPPQYASTANSCCSSPASSSSVCVAPPQQPPGPGLGPIHHDASALEQQMFYLFRTQTVLQVGCVLDMPFWLVDVPQAAQAHRPLWHAAVALAALATSSSHHAFNDTAAAATAAVSAFSDTTTPVGVDGLTAFVMRHYHAAIRELIPLSNPSGDAPTFGNQQVLLMTNVLLLGLASMQGNQRDAAMFARHSLSLFNAWRFWQRQDDWKTSSQGAMLSVAPLTALMYRLQSQEVADRLERPAWLLSEFDQFTRLPSATPFVSQTEAYRELQPMLAGLTLVAKERQLRPYTDFMLPAPDACLTFRYAFTAWRAKYDHFCDSQPPMAEDGLESMILGLLKATVEHALYLSDDYRALLPLHHRMVDTAERILMALTPTAAFDPHIASGSPGASSPTSPDPMSEWSTMPTSTSPPLPEQPRITKVLPYCFGPVVLEPLFIVAIDCVDYGLRRRAISILRRWPRAEGVWSSVIMAAFAEALATVPDAIDGGLEVLENGLGKMQLRSVTDTSENWPGRAVLVTW
ncbi:C6 zinc finger domain protein [Cordyceps fumosorosea ARSEF 2679]|uniref:C6 zinc finger domain protein n=1 Tax=Cordyceps fumosorosea (strain ARSEF 2679) TaxID=1081104 RepID=A0A162MVJ7_CORFA|nr:C6 zinc finger domain protein [Cordyceps fumosorosea ARSEF 2679]OAA71229.1 C6 zinc finger domain protein [Cordyceps fumosorosea ARSEF 2679]